MSFTTSSITTLHTTIIMILNTTHYHFHADDLQISEAENLLLPFSIRLKHTRLTSSHSHQRPWSYDLMVLYMPVYYYYYYYYIILLLLLTLLLMLQHKATGFKRCTKQGMTEYASNVIILLLLLLLLLFTNERSSVFSTNNKTIRSICKR